MVFGMNVSELSKYFPSSYLKILKERSLNEIWPAQAEAIEKGLLDFEWDSFLVSAPHGSGKTFVAELAIMKKLYQNIHGLILYLVPYKAMAREIGERFSFLENTSFGRQVNIWTGDEAIDGDPLVESNVLVLTYELFQLMLRTSLERVLSVDLVVVDELHFIEEHRRGARQEAAITQLLANPQRPPILALCSVVSNTEQIEQWLGCKKHSVLSHWRPTPLREGVLDPDTHTIDFYENGSLVSHEELEYESDLDKDAVLVHMVLDYLESDTDIRAQVIIFVPTRKDARRLAQIISKHLAGRISSEDIELPEEDIIRSHKLLDEIRYSSENTVRTFHKLFSTGVAYHHAGLGKTLRSLIESEFRQRRLIVLVSTTTLGVGVNLPASRVYFYDTRVAQSSISSVKYKNMAGRAGRSGLQEEGESVILTESTMDMESSLDEYILDTEPRLESYLLRDTSETQLALLSWIWQGMRSLSQLKVTLSRSFAPPGMDRRTELTLKNSLDALTRYGFISSDGNESETRYECTDLGRAVITSGAIPSDACLLIRNLGESSEVFRGKAFDRMAALFYLCLTSRFDSSFFGHEVSNESQYSRYIANMDSSGREMTVQVTRRRQQAYFCASLLDSSISEESLKDIGDKLGQFHSAEEVIERLVPSAVEVLQQYLTIAEKCGPERVGSCEQLISHLRILRDSLEIGSDHASADLIRLFRRDANGRKIVQSFRRMDISTVRDLLEYPYEDFSPRDTGLSSREFYDCKARALWSVEDLTRRRAEYVRLLAKYMGEFTDNVEKLLHGPDAFEEGVRSAITGLGQFWPGLESQQVRDRGAGANIPRPEAYLVSSGGEVRLCFEAKTRTDGTPIESHSDALSPLQKCQGRSTHRITVGWLTFDRNLHSVAKDRGVTLLDASTFALLYVWALSGLLDSREFVSVLERCGIVQPEAFETHAPRWWPPSPSV